MHPDASVRPGGFDAPVFVVTGQTARVSIEGGTIRMANGTGGGPGDGVYCVNGADLTLRQLVIEDNDDEGVDSSDCTLSIDRCDIRGNDGGGIAIDDGRFTVTNSFIARNGQPGGNRGGATIDSTEPGVFAHNTVFDNSVQDGQVGGVTCLGDYTLRNNIIAGNDSLQTGGAGCQHRHSLIAPEAPEGDGNIDEPPLFVSEADGDFHLATDSPGIDAGETSDVAFDWDGERRPAGEAPDMGADEVVR